MFPAERTMTQWQGVVAGFDSTGRARCAVRWAAGEAAVRRCPLHVVRIVEHPTPTAVGWLPVLMGPDDQQRDLFENQLVAEVDACRAANPGLEVHAAMHDGPPCARLVEHADQVGADVLVVGVSDLGAVARLVLGSTGAELVHTTKQCVVVVRDPTPVQQAVMATGYAPVVALVDDLTTSARVLAFACDMADRWRSSVAVVHADPRVGRGVDTDRSVPVTALRSRLSAVRRRYSRVTIDVGTVMEQPLRTVLDQSTDARLVVVGGRRHGLLHRLLAGSASHSVLHHAKCSVAVIP